MHDAHRRGDRARRARGRRGDLEAATGVTRGRGSAARSGRARGTLRVVRRLADVGLRATSAGTSTRATGPASRRGAPAQGRRRASSRTATARSCCSTAGRTRRRVALPGIIGDLRAAGCDVRHGRRARRRAGAPRVTGLLLAVDGGNSKTDVVLLERDGTVLGAHRGPTVSHQQVDARGGGAAAAGAGRRAARACAPADAIEAARAVPRRGRLSRRRALRSRGRTGTSGFGRLVLENDTIAGLRAGSPTGLGRGRRGRGGDQRGRGRAGRTAGAVCRPRALER